MAVYIIAAMAQNRVIGNNGTIPWHSAKDFKYFKRMTMGHVCVMGSKTYNSLPENVRPLPGRHTVVLTRDTNKNIPGVQICNSWDQLQSVCHNHGDIFLCGGAQIYRQGLEIADVLLLTIIHEAIDGDTFFPEFDVNEWHEVSREDHTDINKKTGKSVSISFVRYEKIARNYE